MPLAGLETVEMAGRQQTTLPPIEMRKTIGILTP
jgi:hypothetical protein